MGKILNGSYKKAEKLVDTMEELSFRLNKARKNLKWCREGCKEIIEFVGEVNEHIEGRRTNVRKTG